MFRLTRLALGTNTGKVVRWLDNKGFGFVQRSDNDGEVFVHQSAIRMQVCAAFGVHTRPRQSRRCR